MDRSKRDDSLDKYLVLLMAGFCLSLAAAYAFADLDAFIFQSVKSAKPFGRLVGLIGYYLGHGSVVIPGLAAILAFSWVMSRPHLKQAAGWSLTAFIVSGLFAQMFKHLVGRPRPRLWEKGIYHFGPSLASGLDSFPSGHTASIAAVAMVFSLFYPKGAPVLMPAALFVAVSRVIGGSHFPLDIIGGVFLGLAVGLMVGNHGRKKAGARFQGGDDSGILGPEA